MNTLKQLFLLFVLTMPFALTGCEKTAEESQEPAPASNKSHMAHFEVEGEFDGVSEYIKLAITGRGMKINNVSHIGSMLKRTAKAVGASKTIYSKAEAYEFCSATVSRATMEADPHNIVFCPYIIAVYAIEGEDNKVHVAYRHPQLVGTEASKQALQGVEDLLAGIVADAIE